MTEHELELEKKRLEIDNLDKRSDQQRTIVWVAVVAILSVTIIMMLPILSPERLETLSNVMEMFYITQAGIIMTFFGSQAVMTRNR